MVDHDNSFMSMKITVIADDIKTAIRGTFSYLFSLCLLVGGSIGGIGIGVFSDVLLGSTDGVVGIDIDGLPADVERTEGASSTAF